MPFKTSSITYDFKGELDEKSGVYGIMNGVKTIIFAGQTKNLKKEIAGHRANLYDWIHRDGPMFVWFEEITDDPTRRKRVSELTLEYSSYSDAGNRL